jgi:phosphatidylglycerol---prolipoprotein diacylglyceryl transferase
MTDIVIVAEYLHRLDPVILRVTNWLQLRWYGLAYVVGFLAGYWLLTRWARRGIGELRESEVADFITYAAIFGVMIGGRLGYMLLYGREEFMANPISFFHFTKGGMASHGGIAGLFFFTLYWSRRYHRSWTGLGDNLVCAAPVGLFTGRLANFINGELYGRPTTSAWGMKFPEEATRLPLADLPRSQALNDALATVGANDGSRETILNLARVNDTFAELLRPILTLRHPSQLYAAALEGVVLFTLLYIIRERFPRAPHGLLTGIFFIAYAVLRIIGEQFREPDRYIMGVTEGQFYSLFMIVIGAIFIATAAMRRKSSGTNAAR